METAEEVYSTQNISAQLISQIVDALQNKAYGSVEIYIENYNVVQITERSIKKLKVTSHQAKKRFTINIRRDAPFSQRAQTE